MKSSLYLRTVVFGITDSLVSTVGLLAGIALSGVAQREILMTGLIYAFVEAFSMAVGNFLSEESAEEYESKQAAVGRGALGAGVVMFFVFVIASLIPLAPYFFWTGTLALLASIGASIIALFVMGVVSGAIAQLPVVVRGMRMALLGGAAIIIGAIVGLLFKP